MRLDVQIQLARRADSPLGIQGGVCSKFPRGWFAPYGLWYLSLQLVSTIIEAAAGRARVGHGK